MTTKKLETEWSYVQAEIDDIDNMVMRCSPSIQPHLKTADKVRVLIQSLELSQALAEELSGHLHTVSTELDKTRIVMARMVATHKE